MITEIEEETQSNQSKVTEAMASFRQIIDEQERVLLKNIQDVEKNEKQSIEEYKRQLQGEQQNLIEQILNVVVISKDKQPMKRWEAKKPFDDYIKGTHLKLLELKPLTRTKQHVLGLDKLKGMEDDIKNIKVDKVPEYQNQPLRQRIASNTDRSKLNLSSSKLTDQDMEIVASELKTNKVRDHSFFFSFRLVQCHRSKVFQRATSIAYHLLFFLR
jgi:hypothetical protein